MPAARASIGVRKWTCRPSRKISPLSGISAPDSALIRLDLPAPLSPMTARISPGYSSRSLPSMATTRPYRLVRPFACSTGVWSLLPAGSGRRCDAVTLMASPPPPCSVGPRSRLHLPDPLVERDGDQHQQADREALPDHLDAAELQAVAEHADDQRADQRAEHAAAAAEQPRAAEHDGGDGV